MLTVRELVSECGLGLLAGDGSGARPIRWVHISELEDPTPWLSGGELLLTTGIALSTPARQRRYVAQLVEHGVAGLGLGTGFAHKRVPKGLRDAAAEQDLPLFEVPYEMPFIAITERAFSRLVNEHYDVLRRDAAVHERLERLVIEGRGLDSLVAEIGSAAGGSAVVHDAAGEVIARHPRRGALGVEALRDLGQEVAARAASASVGAFEPRSGGLARKAISVPVPGRRGGSPLAWLTVIADRKPLADFERLVARHAAMAVGLELMRERVVRETERRLAGNVLAAALGGRLDPEELGARLRPFGIGERAALLLFEVDDPAGAEARLEAAITAAGANGLVATTESGARSFLCAVVDGDGPDPVEVARRAREALARRSAAVRAAASRRLPATSLRRAFHEARCALEATAARNGGAPEVATHEDLGAFTLLLSLQDDDALRLYSDGILEPIEAAEGSYGDELLRSLEAFIEHNGNWERAARELYCHRHTLRYRIRKIEELTGRDLSRATDRIEVWLALRARELVG
jgi:PucR family transcriptional regulator, purine catabolism regulatory protein